MDLITSSENSVFKRAKKLKQKKYREEYNLFLAEGHKFLDFSETPLQIFVNLDSKILEDKSIGNKIDKLNCKKYGVHEKLFRELTSQESSQGIILVYRIPEIESIDSEILVVLDRVADPGNLGTIIRLCDAVGFTNILLTKGSADVYNEKVIRSTMGSIFNIKFRYLEEEQIVSHLKENKYKIFSTALDKSSINYDHLELSTKCAFVFGNEGVGVSKNILEISDEKVIIPIYGSAESLNVAMAAGIMLYKVRELINNR